MFGSTETSCIENIIKFIKDNPRFRPLTLEDNGELLQDIDYRKAFILIRGSYKSNDLVIGMMLNYNITDPGNSNSPVTLLYRIKGDLDIRVSFSKEDADNWAIKKIGPEPEVSIGDQEVDNKYIIMTDEPEKLKDVIKQSTLRDFLLSHVDNLQKLEIRETDIEYERIFDPEKFVSDDIQKDLDDLTDLLVSLTTEEDESV
jgi:hypothetical protein